MLQESKSRNEARDKQEKSEAGKREKGKAALRQKKAEKEVSIPVFI